MKDYFNMVFGLLLVASGALGITVSLIPWMNKYDEERERSL